MATVKRFEELEVWRKARMLAKKIYNITSIEPLSKDYRLKDQMRGSAGSIMDNIAEGFDRGSRLEFVNFLGYSKGETGELKSQLYRCMDAGYIAPDLFNELYEQTDEVARMVSAFIQYLNNSEIKGYKFKNR